MMHRREFHAMGCGMSGVVETDEYPEALDDLPDQFEEWEQVLSRFRNDSELTRLNRSDECTVNVSPVLWEVFEASREAEAQTAGLVNPFIAEALSDAGYDRSFELIQAAGSEGGLSAVRADVPLLTAIIVDAATRGICLPRGAQLDFGGIAKGWAAQQVIKVLGAFGPALFSAGGDIAVSGLRTNGEAWDIGVDDPFHPGEYLEILYLEAGGVATSGRDYRRWTRGGIAQHHVIDPRTSLPAETDVLTATVIAPSVMRAEAMAKAVLISGSEAGLAWLDSDDSLAGMLVLENGERLYTKNMSDYL